MIKLVVFDFDETLVNPVEMYKIYVALKAATIAAKLGPKTVAITLGERGAMALSGNKPRHFPPTKPMPRHTVGAGDKFFALFLAHFVETMDGSLSARKAISSISEHVGK